MYKFAKSLQSMKSGRSYKAGQAVPSELFDGQALDVLLADGTVIEASDPKIKKPTSIDKPADIPEALKTEYPLPTNAVLSENDPVPEELLPVEDIDVVMKKDAADKELEDEVGSDDAVFQKLEDEVGSDDAVFQKLKTKADKAKADLDKPKGKTK